MVTPSWLKKPAGTERVDKNGYIRVVTGYGKERLRSRVAWERYHEPVKPDEVLLHLDGDKANDDINNLYLLKRKYLGALNHLPKVPLELKRLQINTAILMVEATAKAQHGVPKNDHWKEYAELYQQGKTATEIAEITGKAPNTVRAALSKYRMGFYDNYKPYSHAKYFYQGQTLKSWCEQHGLSAGVVYLRIKGGKTIEEAVYETITLQRKKSKGISERKRRKI